mgnify:CR=1 FL=1
MSKQRLGKVAGRGISRRSGPDISGHLDQNSGGDSQKCPETQRFRRRACKAAPAVINAPGGAASEPKSRWSRARHEPRHLVLLSRPPTSSRATSSYPSSAHRHIANVKYTTTRAGNSRWRFSTRPAAASTSSTSAGGNVAVSTPTAIRSGKRSTTDGLNWPTLVMNRPYQPSH